MYEEWCVGGKQRRVVVDINHLYPHDGRAVLVPCARVVRADLKPVDVLDLAVQWNCGLDDTGAWWIDDKR